MATTVQPIRWWASALAPVLILTLVAACTAEPPVAPSVSVAPTVPAPMASPAKPAAWSDTGEGGAAAAAVWFVRDLYAYVRETYDTADWQALSTTDCQFCQATVDDAKAQAGLGHLSREGLFTVTVTRTEELNPLAYSVLVDFDKPPTTVYRADGSVLASTAGAHGQMLLVLLREGPDWLLREGQWFERGASVPSTLSTP
jgi:hypothetical protein